MTTLLEQVGALLSLLEAGDTLAIIERLYAPDVCVFENHVLSRAGKQACLDFEREQLAAQKAPPTFKVHVHAVNEADGASFIEHTIRFTGPDGRPMRLEQVSVQRWHRGLIAEERFYYEGVIDEGDED